MTENRQQMLVVVTAGAMGLALAPEGSASILALVLLALGGLAGTHRTLLPSVAGIRRAGGPRRGLHIPSIYLRDSAGSGDDDLNWSPDGLEFADSEEISFLPPYATDDPEELDEEDEDEEEWTPPFEANGATGNVEVPDPVEPVRDVPIPRHFALGTVAIIRRLLEPAEVARILLEQRRQPRLRFGDLAVQMKLLDDTQLRELLVAQQEGLFTDEEIREARARLRAFREIEASRDPSAA